jgi:hypothetical protein
MRENRLDGYLHDEGIRYIVQNVYPRGDLLLDVGGLSVRMNTVDTVVSAPLEFPELTAFGLYRLKNIEPAVKTASQ